MVKSTRNETKTVIVRTLCGVALGLAGTACRANELVTEDPNLAPIAVAQVIGPSGASLKTTEDGSIVEFPFAGAPVTVTLDASQSVDSDGQVAVHRWRSGTLVTGTNKLFVPEGQQPGWPDDTIMPTVTLGEGLWSFSLWAIDDDGATSVADSVTFRIGEPPPEVPEGDGGAGDPVAECIGTVYAMVDPACAECLCGVSDDCRAAANQSVCGEACWGLVNCIATMCPDYEMDPGGAGRMCAIANCMPFLAGAASSGMIAPCIAECPEACSAM